MRVPAVADHFEQAPEQRGVVGGHTGCDSTGEEVLRGEVEVGDRAAERVRQHLGSAGEGVQGCAAEVVGLTGVGAGRVEQQRGRHVGDVVGIDERLEAVGRGCSQHTVGDTLGEDAFGEVLGKPAGADDRRVETGGQQRQLGATVGDVVAGVDAAGAEQHGPTDTVGTGTLEQGRAGRDVVDHESRRDHVDGISADECRVVRRYVVPIETHGDDVGLHRARGAGGCTHGGAGSCQPLDDAAAGLAGGSENEDVGHDGSS